VIPGSTFCKQYSSFWREIAPTTDLFVRRVNLGQYERDYPEIAFQTLPNRRGFINEVAFELFCESVRDNERWPCRPPSTEQIQSAAASVQSTVMRRGAARDFELESPPTGEEILDIAEQHYRLMQVFTYYYWGANIVPGPVFRGCGVVDKCIGDVLVSSTLFEIKAGDRLFRSIDVRQLIIYATLNYVSKQYEITRVGIFNPRVGIRIDLGLDELCFEISGKRSIELLSVNSCSLTGGQFSG
jgi:hypothetical protein